MRTNTGQVLYIPRIGKRADLQHPLMKGCVGWWPLNDGAGTKAKDLTGTADLTSTSPNWGESSIGTVGVFPGSSTASFVASSYVPVSGTGELSVSAWFKTTSGGVGSIVTWGTASAGQVFELNVEGGVIWSRNFSGNTASGGSGFNDGEWHVVTLTKPGNGTTSDMKMFVDGKQLSVTAGGSTTLSFGTSSPLEIGDRGYSSSKSFDGEIQNVRAYNRVLSATEILELYTNPWSGLSMPSETRYFFFSSPSPTINPFSRIITSSTILNKSGKTVIRRGV